MLTTKEVQLLNDFVKPLIELADMYEYDSIVVFVSSAEKGTLCIQCCGKGRKYSISGISMKLLRPYSREEIAEVESFCGISSRRKSLEVSMCHKLYLFLKSINSRGVIPESFRVDVVNGTATQFGVSNSDVV